MHTRSVTIPTLALIGSTRGMLGAGLGLLLANKLSDARRRGVGSSLLAVGLLSTIPLALHVFRSNPNNNGSMNNDSSMNNNGSMLADAPEERERRGRHQVLPIALAGTVEAQRK
jgi:hypothetical protein